MSVVKTIVLERDPSIVLVASYVYKVSTELAQSFYTGLSSSELGPNYTNLVIMPNTLGSINNGPPCNEEKTMWDLGNGMVPIPQHVVLELDIAYDEDFLIHEGFSERTEELRIHVLKRTRS